MLGGARMGQRDVDLGADDPERRAHLVRGVGGEAALALEGGVEPRDHLVEGARQTPDLVVRQVQAQAAARGPRHRSARRRG